MGIRCNKEILYMNSEKESLERAAVEKLFAERRDFIIIGLTGRTGCGCTTVAKLLRNDFENLQPPIPISNGMIASREYKIVYDYSKNTWKPFRLIEMKHVIFTFILENSFEDTSEFVNSIAGKTIDISKLKERYQGLHEKRLKYKEEVNK